VRRSTRLPLEALAPYVLDLGPPAAGEPASPFDWRTIFGNDRPVEIEVGCGKGLFLLTAALARPDVNFLGIEIVRKYQLFTATRMAKRSLTNVRVCCADARVLLGERVPAASVQAVHVYFPDPWWKKRHHKRRVFTADFVASIERVLAPGGRLSAATDVESYFHVMADLVRARPGLSELPAPEPDAPANDLGYLTNFERKARLVGKQVNRIAAERVAEGV
jgi:tRNA (guanine-N7-)-methyltransferase